MTRLFISYAREDEAFASELRRSLEEAGFETRIDSEDIRPSEEWLSRILALIESADAVIFVLTPSFNRSRVCGLEVDHAAKHKKRLLPVVRDRTPAEDVHEALRAHNWIHFTAGDDERQAFDELRSAIVTDLAWVTEHTRLLEQALYWDRNGRRAGDTLRGQSLRSASEWLVLADDDTRQPAPLHAPYVAASLRAQRVRRAIGTALTLLLTVGAVLSWMFWNRSQDNERAAISSELARIRESGPSPLDLSRRPYLRDLVERARASAHEGLGELCERLARIPPDSARLQGLAEDPSRRGLFTGGNGGGIVLWYPDRLVVYPPDLGAPLSQLDAGRGRIVWAEPAPDLDGLLYEVEYPDFADAERAERVIEDSGQRFLERTRDEVDPDQDSRSRIFGSERELFLADLAGGVAESLGLSRRLDERGLPGDAQHSFDAGFLFEASDDWVAAREGLIRDRYWDEQLATRRIAAGLGARDHELTVTPLALRAGGRYCLCAVEHRHSMRTFAGRLDYAKLLTVLLDARGRVLRLDDGVTYAKRARFFGAAVPGLPLDLTPQKPMVLPAALGLEHHRAVTRDRVFDFSPGRAARSIQLELAPGWDGAASLDLTDGGRELIVAFEDRRIALHDIGEGETLRLFLGNDPGIRRVAASQDGRDVYVLTETGAVRRWDFAAFGPAGWAAEASFTCEAP